MDNCLEDLLYTHKLYEGDLAYNFAKIRFDLAIMLSHSFLYSKELTNKILTTKPNTKGILYLRRIYKALKYKI